MQTLKMTLLIAFGRVFSGSFVSPAVNPIDSTPMKDTVTGPSVFMKEPIPFGKNPPNFHRLLIPIWELLFITANINKIVPTPIHLYIYKMNDNLIQVSFVHDIKTKLFQHQLTLKL